MRLSRLLRLFSLLEVERAKLRLVEGNFAAARYHTAASSPKSLRMRAALVGLHFMPMLVRRIYVALHHPMPRRAATVG